MIIQIPVSKIVLNFTTEDLNPKTLDAITKSIATVGLLQPVLVARSNSAYQLIAGRYRVAAAMGLGYEDIAVSILDGDEIYHEMANIAADLHRRDLTHLEKAKLVARWLELEKLRASRAVSQPGGRGNTGGTRAAARALGIPESTARDMEKIASLTSEAQDVAIAAGLDNHAHILKAAAQAAPVNQPQRLREYAGQRETPIDKSESLTAALNLAELVRQHIPATQWPAIIKLVRTTKINVLLNALEEALCETESLH